MSYLASLVPSLSIAAPFFGGTVKAAVLVGAIVLGVIVILNTIVLKMEFRFVVFACHFLAGCPAKTLIFLMGLVMDRSSFSRPLGSSSPPAGCRQAPFFFHGYSVRLLSFSKESISLEARSFFFKAWSWCMSLLPPFSNYIIV